jgi:hypothetical protein
MPFVGEQPKSAGAIKVYGRSVITEIDIAAGVAIIAARAGDVEIGVN